jgi:hypothetical protein
MAVVRRPLPAAPLAGRRGYLIVVPTLLPAAPLIARRRVLLGRVSKAVARGKTHIKSALHLRSKPQRRPTWKKVDIPIIQIDGEVRVVGEDRL